MSDLCVNQFLSSSYQYERFKLGIVCSDLHLVSDLNHCSRSGVLFCPGNWWRRDNETQLANVQTGTLELMWQRLESSVLVHVKSEVQVIVYGQLRGQHCQGYDNSTLYRKLKD